MPQPTPEQVEELRTRIFDRYGDDELATELADDAVRNGNTQRVLDGSLTLPHPRDARLWLERLKAERESQR